VKLRSVLFFTLFFFAFANVCLAQAAEEPPVREESEKEEITESEKPTKKKKKKKSVKEETISEDHDTSIEEEPVVEEKADPEESKKKKKEKKKKNKKEESLPPVDEFNSEQTSPEQEGSEEVTSDQVAPAEPAKLEDDGKKDTWFSIFKMKRCPIKSCDTKMVHTHEGKKFRGVKKLKIIQNPKTGELVRKPVTDPKEHKKSPKVRKKREYQKDFKLPKKEK
jgi:hypothetical protein